MSIIRGSNYGRRYEQRHTQICDPFEDPEIRAALTSSHMAFPRETSSILHAQIEFKERPEAYVYKAHLPGLKPDEVIVEVEEDRVLCISGEKKVAKEEKKGMWHHVAQSSGHFVQRLSLPANVKVDQVKAYMDSGVLTVTVPKYEVVNRRATRPRLVNISGH